MPCGTTVRRSRSIGSKSNRSRSRSRQSHSTGSPRKCLKPGPIGRNPYLNFLREFRKQCCGMTPVQTVVQGAKAWNTLSKEEKLRYVEEAFYAPKRRPRAATRMSRSRNRGSRSSRTRRRSSSRKSRRSVSRNSSRRSTSRKSRKSAESKAKIVCNL